MSILLLGGERLETVQAGWEKDREIEDRLEKELMNVNERKSSVRKGEMKSWAGR